ncbi:hypothetical protein [Halosimplex salinum]|uniref:hypothetical protein n=1 Tax=Halosimplex salinum TaxID=1710538 RepID=UPI000F4A0B9F|nr:hypothetical protein [Halosimplex salinum]
MRVAAKQVYAVGFGLGLIGSLAVVAGLVLGGSAAFGVGALGATFTFALGLVRLSDREDFDRAHSLAYRVANLGGAVFVVALGLLMLAIGITTLVAFGDGSVGVFG